MDWSFSRRGLLQGAAAVGGVLAASAAGAGPLEKARAERHPGWVFGRMTGAEALVEALLAEGVGCVYGIPGAQENELWDTFKEKGLPYLLVTHEFSAACMADGYARSTGRPGVLCTVAVVVPYNLFIEAHDFRCPPPAAPAPPFDDEAFERAVGFLADPKARVGIYAGAGCMAFSEELAAVAELLQAPVATSVSGKGV